MKKIILYALLSLLLISCGFVSQPPKQINQNLQRLPAGTRINVVALTPMDIPNQNQTTVVNSTAFRVTQDLRDPQNATLVIAKNGLISGVYTNDGKSCQISWQAVYNDYAALEQDQAALGIGPLVENNRCDPKLGIRPGQLFIITFK